MAYPSRVTQPEQLRFTPKQAVELSVANGEGPAGTVAAEGTRDILWARRPGAFLCLRSLRV